MNTASGIEYADLNLPALSDKLHLNYYSVIKGLVQKAYERLLALKSIDIGQVTLSYTDACSKLLHKISTYLRERENMLIPYLKELDQKKSGGHDCGSCSGQCDMGHKYHIAALKESHYQITDLLHHLHAAALPLYSSTPYPTLYRDLRNEMLLIDTILRQLLFAEEAHLMPQILETQRKINIHA